MVRQEKKFKVKWLLRGWLVWRMAVAVKRILPGL